MKKNAANMSYMEEGNEELDGVTCTMPVNDTMPIKAKKPVYKRWWFWVIVAVVIIAGLTNTGYKESGAVENTGAAAIAEAADTIMASADEHTATDPKSTIEQTIRDRITDNYADTTIDSITINKNLGTVDDTNDYIALVYLTWSLKNTGPTAKPVLQLYGDDLATTIGESCEDLAEVVVFWNVTYLDANVKVAYERNGSGAMLETDSMWPAVFEG